MTFGNIPVGSSFSLVGDSQGVIWKKTVTTQHVLIGACPDCQEKGTNAVSGGFSTHFCPQDEVIQK